ncbi:MAG: 4'-phosphopantetheinyl transferase family protein [Anaerovoracaceae bacterium]|jgi:4'-phosphopantetheinyl transferase
MIIYWKKKTEGETSHGLLRRAAAAYAAQAGIPFDAARCEIVTAPGGKPFFRGDPFFFSITHTGDLWACAFSSENIGLDVQKKKDVPPYRVAGRLFTEREQALVRTGGRDAFYQIWTRREALAKWSGGSVMTSGFPDLTGDRIEWKGAALRLTDLDVWSGAAGALVSEQEDPEVRIVEMEEAD